MVFDQPAEVWANIFAQVGASTGRNIHLGVADPAYEKQKWFFHLQIVCRKFRSVFKAESGLTSALVLRKEFKEASIPSLLKCGRQNSRSIKGIITECGSPHLEVALAGIGGHQAALQSASCRQCTTSSIHLLSTLTALKRCSLSSNIKDMDISSLEPLPALHDLDLSYGSFTSRQLPAGPQSLRLCEADLYAGPACKDIKNLRKLTLAGGELSLMPEGLAACCQVQDLQCSPGSVLSAER